MTLNFTALILAGNRSGPDDAVAKDAGVSCKALVDIGGMPMIERVIKALQESTVADRMIVSLPEGVVFNQATERSQAQDSPVRSLLKMLEMLKDDEPILVTTADHALLSPAMVQDFVNQYDAECFDSAVALLPLEILQKKYPSMRRTRLIFKEGHYKACNLFLFRNKKAAQAVLKFWLSIETNRKKPWKMFRALGLTTLLLYATKQLGLHQALARLGALTGTKPQAVLLDIPEAAIDVDTVHDLEFVRGLVSAEI